VISLAIFLVTSVSRAGKLDQPFVFILLALVHMYGSKFWSLYMCIKKGLHCGEMLTASFPFTLLYFTLLYFTFFLPIAWKVLRIAFNHLSVVLPHPKLPRSRAKGLVRILRLVPALFCFLPHGRARVLVKL